VTEASRTRDATDAVDATRRTRLANERTFLAWLRTSLTAVAVAIGAGKIVPGVTNVTHWPFQLLGAAFAAVAVVLMGYGAQRFHAVERALSEGDYVPLRSRDAYVLGAIIGVLGLVSLAFIFVH
jgi:putative membrane protein